MSSNTKIYELCQMMEDYPSAEVLFMVAGDVASEDFGYWTCDISSIEFDYYYLDEKKERFYIGEDEIMDELSCDEKTFKALYDEGKIDKRIIVRLDVPRG